MEIMVMLMFTIYGITALCFLQPTSAAVINESYSGYLFTVPDQPDSVTNTKTKIEAQLWCQRYDSALLEIYDSQLQQTVESFISKTSGQQPLFGNRNMFTNGMRTGTPWMWVNGNSYIGAGILNQLDRDYVYGYLLLNQTGLFFIADNMPANRRSYICEKNNLSDWGFRYNDRYYVSISTTLSWYDARNECLDGGGDLASFDFVTDQQSLNSLNGSWITANTPYWIGLRRQSWMWQRSELEIKYTHWDDGHPQSTSGDCLCLLSKGYRYEWTECNCDTSFQFICMKTISEASTSASLSTLMRTTALSLTSPASASSSTYGQFSSVSAVGTNLSNDSSLGVGLGVGFGVGLPLLVVILIMAFIMIRMKRKLRKSESSGISSSDNKRVEMTSTPAYESLQNGTTMNSGNNSNSTYQELNITN